MNNRALKQQSPPNPMAEIAAINSVLSSQQLERPDALNFVTERALSLTGGNGAALALQDGEAIRCCASTGQAPPLNATIRPDSGISGECLQTGASLLCEDTINDPRVDREACEALGIRATAVVPLCSATSTLGLLQVFDSKPQTFTQEHLALLKMLADIVVEFTRNSGKSDSDKSDTDSGPGKKPAQNQDWVDEPKPRPSWAIGSKQKFQSEEKSDASPASTIAKAQANTTAVEVAPAETIAIRIAGVREQPPTQAPRSFGDLFTGRRRRKLAQNSPYISGTPRFGIDVACALVMAFLIIFFVVRFWQPLAHAQFAQQSPEARKILNAVNLAKPPASTTIPASKVGRASSELNSGRPARPVTAPWNPKSESAHLIPAHVPPNRTAYQLGPVPTTHLNVTDPLSAYEIQSLDANSVYNLVREAQSGDSDAEMQLGSAYELGRGLTQSCETAARWIMRAAQQGNAAAQYNLGLRYAQGDGLYQDMAESHKWLKKAIEQGYLARRASYAAATSGD